MKYLIYTLFLIIGFVLGTFWGINQLENKIMERLKEREACLEPVAKMDAFTLDTVAIICYPKN